LQTVCQNSTTAHFGQVFANGPDRCPQCGEYTSLAPGTLVTGPQGQYTIVRELGRGGMGAVCLATDSTGHNVVIKQFFNDANPANVAINADNRKRFEREADYQQLITHPAFPRGLGWWIESGKLLMAMEFVPGETWTKAIETSPGGRMDLLQACQVTIQIASALDYLHSLVNPATGAALHIVHRDIKPDNIMIMSTGQVKVLDLGIARPADLTQATVARGTLVVGSGEYVAPEQLGVPGPGGKQLTFDGRADQYSLAASLYHALAGQPFDDVRQGGWKNRHNSVRQHISNVEIQGVIRKAISIDPDDRYATAREFAQAVAHAHTQMAPLPAHLQQFVHSVPATQVFTFGGTGLFPTGPINLPATVAVPNPSGTSGQLATGTPMAFNPRLVKIKVQRMPTRVISATEFERVVKGRVTYQRAGMPNVTIRPEISEVGGPKNGPGNDVKTGAGGDFTLDMDDYRVPLTVERRDLILLVLDNSGAEVTRTSVKIKRPWGYNRQAAQAAGTYVPPVRRAMNWVRGINWDRAYQPVLDFFVSGLEKGGIVVTVALGILSLVGMFFTSTALATLPISFVPFCFRTKSVFLRGLRWIFFIAWGGNWLVVTISDVVRFFTGVAHVAQFWR